jgi:PAS domain S-box-containing protein
MFLTGTIFSEENFKKIIEFAPIGIVIIDRDYNWLLTNRRFSEIVGYAHEELVGKTFLDITHPADRSNNVNLYQKMLEGEYNEYQYEKRYVRKDGKVIWARLIVSGVRIHGEYSHLIALVEDINEAKTYKQNLENKNKELDTLFYKVSHDLKAPVTTLQGLCHLLKLEAEKLADTQLFGHLEQTVARLQQQNESLLQLNNINDHLNNPTSIYLEKLVDTIVQQLDQPFTLEKNGLDAVIQADYYLLSMALKCIIENAIIFNESNEVIIKISCSSNAPDTITITVEANGPGISSDIVNEIFHMFYRGSSQSKGNGLGLYITRKAIEKMNGSIEVNSTPGSGSAFSIELPKVNINSSPGS